MMHTCAAVLSAGQCSYMGHCAPRTTHGKQTAHLSVFTTETTWMHAHNPPRTGLHASRSAGGDGCIRHELH